MANSPYLNITIRRCRTMSDKYNGWTNYETWAANLWSDQDYWFAQAKESGSIGTLAEQMKDECVSYMDNIIQTNGMFTDLLQSAFDQINWFEIAEHIFEDANEGVK
jgi:hypothetical protein